MVTGSVMDWVTVTAKVMPKDWDLAKATAGRSAMDSVMGQASDCCSDFADHWA